MRAMAQGKFGGPDLLQLTDLPQPTPESGEVLIQVEWAGVGEWDPFEREGGYAEAFGIEPRFPYVLGSEGSGTIAALGSGVASFKIGDRVFAPAFLNPKGGFFAEYVAVDAALVSAVPPQLTMPQAAVMSGVGMTALRGLQDILNLTEREALVIFGASGSMGHLAIQLGKLMGAHVIAVASGPDGVALAKRLGADQAFDGREPGLADSLARAGADVALLTAGGDAAEAVLASLRPGGRAAYPNGINPVPEPPGGVELTAFNGEPDPDLIGRFNTLIASGPFTVEIAETFPLEQVPQAHEALKRHHLGKLVIQVA